MAALERVAKPFPRITYDEALVRLRDAGKPVEWGDDFGADEETVLASQFDRPVLVRMVHGSDLEKLGFITEDDLAHLGIAGGKVAVYLPHSFAWSGNLYIVPAQNVTPIDARAADVMKFVVSGGVAKVDDDAH